MGPLWSGFRILLKLIFSQALRGRGHCTLKSTQGVSLHSTSSPCLQGDLPKLCQHAADLFTSEAILSAYPDHPSSRDSGMQKTPGGPDYQDPEHPDIGSILVINQAPASWRPHASRDTGHGAHYRATRPRYRGIIVLFVIPRLLFIVRVIIVITLWCSLLL